MHGLCNSRMRSKSFILLLMMPEGQKSLVPFSFPLNITHPKTKSWTPLRIWPRCLQLAKCQRGGQVVVREIGMRRTLQKKQAVALHKPA